MNNNIAHTQPTKDELASEKFHKGQRISFWGMTFRIGRIIKKYKNVAVVNNSQEIWLVPFSCMKAI